MGKHRLDQRNDRAWGGPALTSMVDSSLPVRHSEEAEPDEETTPMSRVGADPAQERPES